MARGCLQAADVQVGYYALVTVRPSRLRIGPSPDAPVVVDKHGHVLELDAGARFGAQSALNPEGRADPPLKVPINGYRLGYLAKGGTTGWLAADALDWWEGEPFADGPTPTDDLEDRDFQVGAKDPFPNRPRPHPRKKLVGHPAGGKATVEPRDVYFRYAQRGTAQGYLVHGDRVQRRWVGWKGHYTCCVVLEAKWMPAGAVGWIESKALNSG